MDFWGERETRPGAGFRRGGCRGPQRTYDSSVCRIRSARRGVGKTYRRDWSDAGAALTLAGSETFVRNAPALTWATPANASSLSFACRNQPSQQSPCSNMQIVGSNFGCAAFFVHFASTTATVQGYHIQTECTDNDTVFRRQTASFDCEGKKICNQMKRPRELNISVQLTMATGFAVELLISFSPPAKKKNERFTLKIFSSFRRWHFNKTAFTSLEMTAFSVQLKGKNKNKCLLSTI